VVVEIVVRASLAADRGTPSDLSELVTGDT
jgi:hypothetical protein